MRELDRNHLTSCAIVGAGRLGTALAGALRATGLAIDGPRGRGADPRGVDAVLLCVPDGEIAAAAAAVSSGVPVGHCSGATGLDVLAGHEAFGLHPLMTVPYDDEVVKAGSRAPRGRSPQEGMPQEGEPEPVPHDGEAVKRVFAGAGAAIAGSTPRALAVARELAQRLGMRATTVADEDRAAYHAAASIASNFLVTLEGAAERLAGSAGVERELLAPLVRAAVDNWARLGAERALTGPIARGDEATVARQRAAVAERAPDLVAMYDALAQATRALAGAAGDPPGGDRNPLAGAAGPHNPIAGAPR
jgi:predicted short-subunit dehydrogenase-like oxidoreductase (DUF2520 family)